MTTIKNVTEESKEKKKQELKSLIGFLSANKIDNYNGAGGGKKIQRVCRTSKKIIINVFLESLLSESFPMLGITVQFTFLGCPPTLY